MSREPKRLGGLGTVIVVALILALIAATGFVVWLCIDMVNQVPEATQPTSGVELPVDPTNEMPTEAPTETTEPPTTEPESTEPSEDTEPDTTEPETSEPETSEPGDDPNADWQEFKMYYYINSGGNLSPNCRQRQI